MAYTSTCGNGGIAAIITGFNTPDAQTVGPRGCLNRLRSPFGHPH